MIGRQLTLTQMYAVREVARRGNFTAAARHLQMSQSALTRTIQDAERAIKVSLFNRSTRSVHVTPSGAELLAVIDNVLDALEDGLSAFDAFTRLERGTLAVSMLPSVAAVLLPPILQSITVGTSTLRVVTLDGPADEVAGHLLDGDAEIALTACIGDERMHETPLIEEDFLVLAKPPAPWPAGEPVTWATLLTHEVVTTRVGTSIRLLVDGALEAMGARISGHLQASTVATVGGLVRSGLGVTLLPALEIQGYGLTDLQAAPLIEPTLVRHLGLVHLADRELSPAAAYFSQIAVSTLSSAVIPHGARFMRG